LVLVSDLPLESRTAVVTGSGRGIGKEEALAIASLGANVVVNDIGCELDGTGRDRRIAEEVVAEIVKTGGQAVSSSHDVTREEEVKALMELALDTYGSVDIVVNNAGLMRHRPITELSVDDFDSVMNIHVRAPFMLSRAAAMLWRDQTDHVRHRRIINTTSLAGLWPAIGDAGYSTAKCGVYALSMILAQELPAFGATCNVIAPHGATRMNATWPDAAETQPKDHADRTRNVAAVVAWLATDACREVNGQVLHIQGNLVRRVEGFRSAAEVSVEGAWTYDQLRREGPLLFDGIDSSVPSIDSEVMKSFNAYRIGTSAENVN
jgi:NAD(P)-dependent dehydrogenase (short-subunit alcohol dehydrogenase family)